MHRTLVSALLIGAVLGAHEAHAQRWYRATGTTCSTTDVSAARAVQIKSDKYDAAKEELSFDLVDAEGRRMPVSYRGIRPGNFKDAISIVAIGRYHEGRIDAEKLLVKCPSKYQGAEVEKAYAAQPAAAKAAS